MATLQETGNTEVGEELQETPTPPHPLAASSDFLSTFFLLHLNWAPGNFDVTEEDETTKERPHLKSIIA